MIETKHESKGQHTKARIMLNAIVAIIALACVVAIGGCAQQTAAPEKPATEQQPVAKTLESATLNIYCGAGMTDPFQEIADAFKNETGCTMNVTYANAAQIQTQITTTEQGDYFIAGAADELKPVEKYVAKSTNLVKHIPVLAVPTSKASSITGLADLAGVSRLLIGDPESTPIGKIAKKALTEAGVMQALEASGAITTTTTAPQIATALANGEGDAGIVWKENASVDGVTIVKTSDLDNYVKTVPSARLTTVANAQAADLFDEFLSSSTAHDIWAKYGYEQA